MKKIFLFIFLFISILLSEELKTPEVLPNPEPVPEQLDINNSFITKYEEYTGIETIYKSNNVILIHGNLINDNNNKNDTQ